MIPLAADVNPDFKDDMIRNCCYGSTFLSSRSAKIQTEMVTEEGSEEVNRCEDTLLCWDFD